MSKVERKIVRESEEESKRIFVFGGKSYKSKKVLRIPCELNGIKVFIRTEIIEGDFPWLIGRECLEKMGAIIDVKNNMIIMRELNGLRVEVKVDERNHMRMKVRHNERSNIDCWKVESWLDNENRSLKLKKLHIQFCHASFEKLWKLIERGYRENGQFQEEKGKIRKELENVCQKCDICKVYKNEPSKPVVGMPMASSFNEVLTMDLGELDGRRFLVMVDWATNYVQASWIK